MRSAVHAVLVALLGGICVASGSFAQGLIGADAGSGKGRPIRMHEPTFEFKDTRSKGLDEELSSQGPEPSEEDFGPRPSYTPPPPPEMYAPYAPARDRRSRPKKPRNWILPPTPEALVTEGGLDREEDLEQDGDFRSKARAIYERAYTRDPDEDAEPEEETTSDQWEDGAASDLSYDPDTAMGLLLPESGLALGPVIGLLGDDPSVGDGAARSESGTLGADGQDPYSGAGGLTLGDAEGDPDMGFGADPLFLGGVETAGGRSVSPDDGQGLAMTRSLLANIGRDAADADGGAPISFAPTQIRTEGLGNWRTTLSSTAAAMRTLDEQAVSSSDTFMRTGTEAGYADRSAMGSLTGGEFRDTYARPEGMPAASMFRDPAGPGLGGLPTFSDGGSLGGNTVGGFGTQVGSSLSPSVSPTPSTESRSISPSFDTGASYGTGTRGGVRATDDIPNPLGGSLFD